jgi:hypothetical protein
MVLYVHFIYELNLSHAHWQTRSPIQTGPILILSYAIALVQSIKPNKKLFLPYLEHAVHPHVRPNQSVAPRIEMSNGFGTAVEPTQQKRDFYAKRGPLL